ncbi:TIGR02450 family Trp-rich protein [Vibrio sp. DW001]|uniref:TIGR02450 family Trp-rich protein n=1 Tax=Vibrio sp. DW001 TaxID=2912315 RepID=UPI0023B0282B|nr:TIGR02450 family Trp-rich protein [Vibrio sp. DW001]WED28978.1 TIGR02450 family Trp-rich protein [Vibrio sp. DW001]
MNKINPKKLLNSKWTAVNPIKKEKHFLVTEVEIEGNEVVRCLIEAIISKRSQAINWNDLKNKENWLPGWK